MNKLKIIIINGIARSGKDTFVSLCQKNKSNINIYNLSTITPIKNIVQSIFPEKKIIKKTDKYRKLLSDMKITLDEYNNFSYNWIINQMNKLINFNNNSMNVFFIHCREPDNIEKFKTNLDNCITLLITRPNLKVPNNIADQMVLNYKYDYIIDNDKTLKELNNKSISFCNACISISE